MFTDLHLKDFAAFSDLRWPAHGQVNVIVGENDTGKSHLLKVLYAVAASAGAIGAKKKVTRTNIEARFIDKLQWTFQPSPDLGSLVRHGAETLVVEARLGEREYSLTVESRNPGLDVRIKPDSTVGIETTAVFLPPKEVLTIFAAIEVSRSVHEIYGFDDTYYDLLKLLRIPPTRGKIAPELSAVIEELEGFFGGRISKKGSSDEFSYERGGRVYAMPQTADGIKKLGILTALIRNRSLKKGSILFVDEPETNLHPRAISLFTNMLFRLGQGRDPGLFGDAQLFRDQAARDPRQGARDQRAILLALTAR